MPTLRRETARRRAPCGKGDVKSWLPSSAFHPKAWLRLASSTGLLARGSLLSSAFPEHPQAPVADRVKLAAFSCGGSRGFGQSPHHVPFFAPPRVIPPPARLEPWGNRPQAERCRGIEKPRMATVKWRRSTVSHARANRECGAGRKFQGRSSPRNCKRRARATLPLG